MSQYSLHSEQVDQGGGQPSKTGPVVQPIQVTKTVIHWAIKWMVLGSGIGLLTLCCIPDFFVPPRWFLRIALGAIVGSLVGIGGASIQLMVTGGRGRRVFVVAGLLLCGTVVSLIT